jgi:malonate transporter
MHDIIASVLPIFIITLLGKVIRSYWLKSDEFWRGLETLSYFLLFPVVLFNYIAEADLSSIHLIRLVFALMIATTAVSGGLVVLQKRFNIDGKVFTSIFQGSIRYNSYIFFALGDALYGKEGMVIVAVIAAYMIIFTNFLSVLAFSVYSPMNEEEKLKNNVSQWSIFVKNLTINPLIIASIVGFFFNYLDIDITLSFQRTLQTLSNAALAMGILCVGSGLKFYLSGLNNLAITVSCLAKLIVLPTITFIIFKLMGISGLPHSVGLLYSSLPTATNSYLLSKQLGGDSESMSAIITFSILLSVLSLAVLTYILA